jgi:hypothetical protein
MRVAVVASVPLALTMLMVSSSTVHAKRRAPTPVTPVVHHGVRYTAPTERMGWVEAHDQARNTLLWEVQVYVVTYDQMKEHDVQDVFITELRIEGNDLAVKDERDRGFLVDLASHQVRPRWDLDSAGS